MDRSTSKPPLDRHSLGIGSSLAAGALMLCHMNSSGLTRYDNLIADLSRFQPAQKPLPASRRRSDRPHRRALGWVSWIYR